MGASVSGLTGMNSTRTNSGTTMNTSTAGLSTMTSSMNTAGPNARRNRRFGFGSPSMTGGKSRKARRGSRKAKRRTTRRRR